MPDKLSFKVRVAVRVKPITSHEQPVLQLNDSEISVMPPVAGAKPVVNSYKGFPKHFKFDKCFAQEATQVDIYHKFGRDMVEHTLEGYNACIFAYGQTGSGKTHTMLGDTHNPGLIPQICQHLFNTISSNKKTAAISVRLSYLEIYNEQVRDLLHSSPAESTFNKNTGASSNSLKLRGTSDECQVIGLSEYKVGDVAEVLDLLAKGSQQRSTAATKMNDTSSRSHAVVSLTIKQQLLNSSDSHSVQEKVSVLRLVDLAGSERATSTGATGVRLKEGGNINKSLVTLGRVISTLADPSSGNQVVPYRDSVLTRLLQYSLGGNSRTAMIACVAPDSANLDQTLSTLRYADQAKRITTSAHINEDLISNATQEARFKRMQEELAELRQQLSVAEPMKTGEEELKLSKLVAFYEDEAARERLKSNMMELQKEQAEKRNQELTDYVREISGRGLSSIDLSQTASFESLLETQQQLHNEAKEGLSSIRQSIQKWRNLVAEV